MVNTESAPGRVVVVVVLVDRVRGAALRSPLEQATSNALITASARS